MPRRSVNFGADASEAGALNGYIKGLAGEVNTSQHMSSVVGYVQSELMDAFSLAADAAAMAMPDSFRHVYEWGNSYNDDSTVGSPVHRLWNLVSAGSGANRTVGYVFKPSKVPVPIHPTLLEPGENGRVVQQGKHVFTWKAPIMEYGIRVNVKRIQPTKALAFVGDDGLIKFRKGPFSFVPGQNVNQKVFTSFYMAWWRVEAAEIFNRRLVKELEADVITDGKLKKALSRYKSRPKQFTINTSYEGQKTFASARAQARRDIKKKQKEYNAKTAKGRMKRYGY